LGCWGPLPPSSVLGDFTPEPAEEPTTMKQKEKFSLEFKKLFTEYFRSPIAKSI